MNKYRSHNCSELRKKDVGNKVFLSGWINKKRDHGNLLFIDLRDNYGVTQCIIDKENLNFKELEKIQLETVVKINGKVINRSEDTINKDIETGEVDEKKILNKSKIKKDSLILAVPSSGLHSNGYSLVRNLIDKKKIDINKNYFLKKELIRPTKIYVKEILNLIDKNLIQGCANITGGGLEDNIKRIIPSKLSAEIYLEQIRPLKIFKWLKNLGINDKEMLKTFNCGVGFCLIVNSKNLNKVIKVFPKKYKPYVIGKINYGSSRIKLNEKIKWF